jgi:hypothetical protein
MKRRTTFMLTGMMVLAVGGIAQLSFAEAEPRQIEVFRHAAEKPHRNLRTGRAEYQEHCPGN